MVLLEQEESALISIIVRCKSGEKPHIAGNRFVTDQNLITGGIMVSLPLRYYSSARSDFQSSQINIMYIEKNGDPYRYKSVAFLAGFAIELYLKAWLSADGVEEKGLSSHNVRHDLAELLKMAIARGYSPSSKKIDELIDTLRKLHRKFETRYLKDDTEIQKLTLGGYSAEMEMLDADVRTKISVPPSS
ncbi:HEPN domain-containing protein [Methylobacterium aquaticum]|uniref:HEPN domain-containing protein n=1 Tax=Methylobacterium aquaticum TaxID=270351 RepID=UPI00193250D9|nr:HEPN domain-containing protein [Methylobacterium aquaticum]